MKRSQSATPESTPAKKKPNIASTASDDEPSSGAERKPDKASKTKAASSAPPGEWTPEKREIFMDRLIDCGYRSLDLGALAHELQLKKKQLINAAQPSKKGNLRDRAVKEAGKCGR